MRWLVEAGRRPSLGDKQRGAAPKEVGPAHNGLGPQHVIEIQRCGVLPGCGRVFCIRERDGLR